MGWALSIGLLASLGAIAVAHSATLTCDRFKQRLAEEIHAAGDKIAPPTDYSAASEQAGSLHTRYAILGIAGLNASLACGTDDQFQEVEVAPMLDKALGDENVLRIDHTIAFASAALCGLETIHPGQCEKIVRAIVKKATDEYLAAKRRGKEIPLADEVLTFPNGIQFNLRMADGTLLIKISERPVAPRR